MCKLPKFIDLTDKKVGKLTVQYRVPNKNGRVYWHCVCDCGNEKDIRSEYLSCNRTISCGCYQRSLKQLQMNLMHCKFCEKEFYGINALHNHESRCSLNPNRLLCSDVLKKYCMMTQYESCGWAKGLTKETDDRIKKASQSLKRYNDNNIDTRGRAKTLEAEKLRKQRISNTAHKNHKSGGYRMGSGRGHKGWYKGYFCDSTYELVFVIYNLDHNINFKRNTKRYCYRYKNQTHSYCPDFEMDDGTLVEIKGYHTDLVDVKASAVDDVSLRILYRADLDYMFKYIKETYNYKRIEDLYETA